MDRAAHGGPSRAEILVEATRLFTSVSGDFEQVAQRVVTLLGGVFGDCCVLWLLKDDGRVLNPVAFHHVNPDVAGCITDLISPLPVDGLSMPARVARSGEALLLNGLDASTAHRFVHGDGATYVERFHAHAMLVVPLKRAGRVVGALGVSREKQRAPIDDDDRASLEVVALAAALAQDSARLSSEEERLKEAERRVGRMAERVNRLKDEFLSTVSHELRTPLNAIVGWTHVLQSGDTDPMMAARAVAAIERNAQVQIRLIAELLDTASLSSGRLRVEHQPVDLVPVLEAALESVRKAAEAKRIALFAHLDPQAGRVSGDASRLQQVAWHLLGNAVKFTARGGRVELRLERSDSDLVFEVADDGAGISDELLREIFDPFRQVDAGTTRSQPGLGVGLTLARHLVEAHGGQISVRSAGLGHGATFTVRIPRLASSEALSLPAAGPWPRPHLAGLSVLLVEDDADAREAITLAVQAMGARVVAVPSAEDALIALDQAVPHLILADIALPGMDGHSLLRQVRERSFSTPAIALTGYARPEDRLLALQAGFEMHLPKPVHPAELGLAIARLVGVLDPPLEPGGPVSKTESPGARPGGDLS